MKTLTEYAMRFIKVPYKWGGAHPIDGLDCSGLVQIILQSVGVDPRGDQTSQALYDHLIKTGQETSPQEGAIIFFGSSIDRITHVAYMIDEHRMIEAGGGGSRTRTVNDAVDHEAYVRIRPINSRKDRVSIIMPDYPDYVRQTKF